MATRNANVLIFFKATNKYCLFLVFKNIKTFLYLFMTKIQAFGH